MHFWIDKRSQSCGFGRARVAASLAGSGIGFGHHPRRIGGKHMVPPIHRYPPVEYRSSSRPHHPHRSTQATDSNSSSSGSHHNNYSHHNQSSSSQSHQQPQSRQHTSNHHNHHHQPAAATPSAASSSSGAGRPPETLSATRHEQTTPVGGSEPARLQQFRNILFQRPPAAAVAPNAATLPISGRQHAQHADNFAVQLTSGAALAQTVSSAQFHPIPLQAACRIPARYLGPHTIDLEHGSLGIGPVPSTIAPHDDPSSSISAATAAGHHLVTIPPAVVAAAAAAATVSFETQLLPAHLKCGMWASLALATVFVAGAKLITLDQQGTGLEVLIFGALSMLFFMGACTVSLCRRPRDIVAAATTAVAGPTLGALQDTAGGGGDGGVSGGVQTMGNNGSRMQTDFSILSEQGGQVVEQGGEQRLTQDSTTTITLAAPPPPYHIAILLPDADDEKDDDSPPPSYDKLMV